jgi:hypothetical protein
MIKKQPRREYGDKFRALKLGHNFVVRVDRKARYKPNLMLFLRLCRQYSDKLDTRFSCQKTSAGAIVVSRVEGHGATVSYGLADWERFNSDK